MLDSLSSTADLDTDSLDNRQAFSGIKQLFLFILLSKSYMI